MFSAIIHAQIPQALTYQAVARNASGSALINSTISILISIKDLNATGTTLYSETHVVTTNQFGLFTVAIGTGLVQSGVFANIGWAVGLKFMKVELDATGGSNYVDMGTSQLLSVPYALVAGSVLNSSAGDDWGAQTAVTNTTLGGNGTTTSPLGIAQQGAASGQTLKWNGSQWAPANDLVGAGGDNWGTQSVITNSTLTGAGTSTSPIGLAQQGATTGQTLKWNGAAWAPANDLDNDAQTISLVGSSLTISNGNTVTFPSQINYSAGAGINILGNVITNTGDLSNTNELQTLSVSGNQLTISNGNSVTVNAGNNYSAGTGISVTGTVISNTAPDQIVSITGTGSANVSGLYPNFTVDAADAQILSITGTQISISNGNSINIPAQTTYTAGSGIGIAGNVITNTSLNTDGQTLSISGSTLSITGGNSVAIPVQTPYSAGTGIGIAGTVISNSAPDQTVVLTGGGATSIISAYPNFTISSTDNDIQTLSLNGNNLSILNGNTIALPAQTPYTSGTGIGIAGTVISNSAPDQTVILTGGGATSIISAYPNFTISSTDNDIQTLSLIGNNLSILNGNTITLPAQTPYTSGTGIGIAGTVISNSAPDQTVVLTGGGATSIISAYPNFTISSTDAQQLSLVGNLLSLTNSGSVTLPTGTTYTAGSGIGIVGNVISNSNPDQTVTLTGAGATTITGLYPNFSITSTDNNTTYSAGSGISLVGTIFSLSANTDLTLTGNGGATPLKIAQQGATNGQTLKWNGATWLPANDNDAQTLSIVGTTLSLTNGGSVTLPAGTVYAAGSGINLTGTTFNNNAQTDATLTGNGTVATPLKIAQQGATNNQVLQWNGTTWVPATLTAGGTLGQIVATAYGTDTLFVPALITPPVLIPGLTIPITVPTGYSVFISTDGGMDADGTLAGQFSIVDIQVFIDGALNPGGGGFERLYAANSTFTLKTYNYWHMSFSPILTTGAHTISVQAAFVTGGLGCHVSGDSNKPYMRGQLTVMLIKN